MSEPTQDMPKKNWLENNKLIRNVLLLFVVTSTMLIAGVMLLYGMIAGSLKFSGSIDGGVIVGVIIVTGSAAIYRFLFGKADSDGERGPATIEETTTTTIEKKPKPEPETGE